jgi:hypothetical protein
MLRIALCFHASVLLVLMLLQFDADRQVLISLFALLARSNQGLCASCLQGLQKQQRGAVPSMRVLRCSSVRLCAVLVWTALKMLQMQCCAIFVLEMKLPQVLAFAVLMLILRQNVETRRLSSAAEQCA